MDPNALAGMVFTLVFTCLIGGFILLYPVSRRLGALLESKIASEKGGAALEAGEVTQLAESVRSLESEVRMLKERQEFTENLLTTRERQKLPAEPSRP
jgi:hypothetical protein